MIKVGGVNLEINTYPEMDAKIKDILRIGGTQSGLYAAQRIEDLEKEIERLSDALKGAKVVVEHAKEQIDVTQDRNAKLEKEIEELKEEKSFFVKAYTEKIMAES